MMSLLTENSQGLDWNLESMLTVLVIQTTKRVNLSSLFAQMGETLLAYYLADCIS